MEYLAVALAALTVLMFVAKVVVKRTKSKFDDRLVALLEKYEPQAVEAVKWALAQLDKRRAPKA